MKAIDTLLRTIGIRDGWHYIGITNEYMGEHSWTNGEEVVSIYNVRGEENEPILSINNGRLTFQEALVLADKYMSEEKSNPAAFMHSDRVQSDKGTGDLVRQDEWLNHHKHDYDFDVINPEQIPEP